MRQIGHGAKGFEGLGVKLEWMYPVQVSHMTAWRHGTVTTLATFPKQMAHTLTSVVESG